MKTKPLLTHRRSRSPRRPSLMRSMALVFVVSLALTSAAGAALLLARSGQAVSFGPGQALIWQSPDQLPDWAAAVVEQQIQESDYQIQVALADLNRDRQLEIIVAPAARRYDVFIPDSPLRVALRQTGGWRLSEADLSCRPAAYGRFVTADYWDLACSVEGRRKLLRWNGKHYES